VLTNRSIAEAATFGPTLIDLPHISVHWNGLGATGPPNGRLERVGLFIMRISREEES
jgi:hypothetical protein